MSAETQDWDRLAMSETTVDPVTHAQHTMRCAHRTFTYFKHLAYDLPPARREECRRRAWESYCAARDAYMAIFNAYRGHAPEALEIPQ